MQQPVVLPIAEARCIPGRHCHRSATCARALVAHDVGRPVEDFTVPQGYPGQAWHAALCGGYLDAAKYRQAPQAERPVRDYVRGL